MQIEKLESSQGKNMKKQLLCLTLAAALAGCATPYDQKKSGWTGGVGFSETQLAPDVWQVDFTGNTYTDRETTKKYVLRHAAEIASKQGYAYFKTVDGETARDVKGASGSGYANNGWGGGQSYANSTTSTTMTVQLLKSKEGQGGIVYDAQFLLSSIPVK